MTIVFITHNLGVVAQMCDYVTVMYLGRVVEQAPVDDTTTIRNIPIPAHCCVRSRMSAVNRKSVSSRFAAWCPTRILRSWAARSTHAAIRPCEAICDVEVPGLTVVGKSHVVRCFLHSDNVEEESNVE